MPACAGMTDLRIRIGSNPQKLRPTRKTYPFAIDVPVESRRELAQFFTPLIEAVTNAGPIDGTRLKELKELFAGCTAGLVFVTAFLNRQGFLKCLEEVAWGTEVWVADVPDHMMHFNGKKFLGPSLRAE